MGRLGHTRKSFASPAALPSTMTTSLYSQTPAC